MRRDVMTTVKDLAKALSPWIVEKRRHFHKYPELSFQEHETIKTIGEALEAMGVAYERVHPTGIIATIEGKGPGKTVALRSDIDALSVTEIKQCEYTSVNEGVMHACGHDAHTAINLGAVKILNELKDAFDGKVVFIFQPAEELADGAKAMIASGDWFEEVDNVFGLHVWNNMDAGTVSLESGPRMSSADMFTVRITGRSAHGSMPHEGVDASVVAASILMNLQTLVSREYSPLDSVVVTIGTINSGTRFNVVSGYGELTGTTRYFSVEVGKTIEEKMKRIIEETAAAFGATAELEYHYKTPPLINDEASSAIALSAAEKIMGKEAIQTYPMSTGGEDFGYYIQNKAGCFGFLGTRNVVKGLDAGHHNDSFDIDDSVLWMGSGLYAQYAIDYLTQERR